MHATTSVRDLQRMIGEADKEVKEDGPATMITTAPIAK
jgi:hypothetical protein